MPTVLSIATSLFLASCITALSAQFRAEDFALPWQSADGTAALVAANVATNGWTRPTLAGKGVSFAAATNGVSTPLWFGECATGTVAYAALVVDCTAAPATWSTLLDASSPLRAEPTAYAWQSPDFSTNGVVVAVDTAIDETIPADGTKHLVEAVFAVPVALSELSLGGHPATPAWNRSWPGRVYEVILLFADPADADLSALRAYLSLKWDIDLCISTPDDARTRLRALGVKSDPLFSSIIIAR